MQTAWAVGVGATALESTSGRGREPREPGDDRGQNNHTEADEDEFGTS